MNTVQGSYFDTVNTIAAACSQELLEDAMQQCEAYERLLSKTIPGSDVWNINHAGGGSAVPISPDTRTILACALRFYRRTKGAFNVGAKPLIDVWDVKNRKAPPSEEEIAGAMAHIDLSGMTLGADCVQLSKDPVRIDLGGIAKGYIADRVARFLRNNHVTSALLNFGGNIVCIGSKPDRTPWSIGLQTPFARSQTDYFAVTQVTDACVVTSGIYERYFSFEGKPYHHIIDPATGRPSESGLIAASVTGPDSMTADALATSILLLGWEKGLKLAEETGYDALCVSERGEVYKSEQWQIKFIC